MSTFDKLVAVSDELICSSDTEGYFTDVNPAFTRVLGWSEPELLNRPYIELIHPDDQAATREAVSRLIESGRLTDFRNRYQAKDGTYVWLDWKAYSEGGEIYAIARMRERGRRSTDVDIEQTVTKVIRSAVEGQRRDQKEREAARDAERSAARTTIDEAKDRAHLAESKARTIKTWVAALVAAVGVAGSAVKWAVGKVEENVQRAQELEKRKEHVDEELAASAERDVEQDRKIQRLGEITVETQVQVSDSTTYLGKKIDASSRAARNVPAPPTVERAAEKAAKIKEKRKVEELFKVDPEAPENPFADLERESSAAAADK